MQDHHLKCLKYCSPNNHSCNALFYDLLSICIFFYDLFLFTLMPLFIHWIIRSALPCPFACTYIFKPVCGSNGRTFASECALRRHQCLEPEFDLKLAHVGSCNETEAAFNQTDAALQKKSLKG